MCQKWAVMLNYFQSAWIKQSIWGHDLGISVSPSLCRHGHLQGGADPTQEKHTEPVEQLQWLEQSQHEPRRREEVKHHMQVLQDAG